MMIAKFELNGNMVEIECDAKDRLLDILRNQCSLTGPKEGCGEGECGACSVIMDGKLANSCLIAMGSIGNAKIMTIEGFAGSKQYDVLESTFARAGAVQCGFCTPGMIMAAHALLLEFKNPSEEEIREGISGNLCRCTGYNMIIDAIELAAKEGEGLW